MASKSITLVYYRCAWQIAQLCDVNPSPMGQGTIIHCFLFDPENISKLKSVINAGLLYEPTQDQKNHFEEEARSIAFIRAVEYVNYLRRTPGTEGYSVYDITDVDKENAFRIALNEICPTTSREIGGKILELAAKTTKPFPIIKTKSFTDVTWAYVVDLDEGLLEVWGYKDQGCTDEKTKPIENHRFDDVQWAGPSPPDTCLGRWKLSKLRDPSLRSE